LQRRLPHVELTPRKIDWLHGAGSLAGGTILGFGILSLPSFPIWLWVASVAGLLVFLRARADLFPRIWRSVGYGGGYLRRHASTATTYARSHPRVARTVAIGGMMAVAAIGVFHAYSPLLAVVVLSGTLKAVVSAVTIAWMMAAVRGTVTLGADVRRVGWAV